MNGFITRLVVSLRGLMQAITAISRVTSPDTSGCQVPCASKYKTGDASANIGISVWRDDNSCSRPLAV